jgi:hypothetical protein
MEKTMRRTILLVVLVASLLFGGLASASTLFYSGDFDGVNGLANETDATVSGSPYGAAIYQNFIVPVGQTWNITGLFSNDLMSLDPATAYWEIRSGVSTGNGGTLIASGTGADSVSATGRSGFGFDEFMNLVSGLNVNLGAGQYWFTVVPTDPNSGGRSFMSTTSGSNGVGTAVFDDNFFNSGFFGANFDDTHNWVAPTNFSGGVIGSIVTTTPEPSSLLMLGSGILGFAGLLRRRVTL